MSTVPDRVNRYGGCLIQAAFTGFFGLMLLFDLFTTGSAAFLLVPSGAFAVTCLVFLRPLPRWAMVAALVSLSVTVVLAILRTQGFDERGLWGGAETGALLFLIVRVLAEVRVQRHAIALTTLLSGAVLAAPARSSGFFAPTWLPLLGLVIAVAIGVGGYLRALENRRAQALADVRQAERLEIARDLHDFVAHHVTGIIVQTQAVRHTGGTADAETLDKMLGGIERSATEALGSMRRLVQVLRSTDGDEPGADAPRQPAADLDAVAELVRSFSETGPRATFTSSVNGTLPPEIGTSIFRIVQESLTNVRRHAIGATSVAVAVYPTDDGAGVSVRDDGSAGPPAQPGFGLAGLTERVGALGGGLRAGPRPEGGFEVVARLPYSS